MIIVTGGAGLIGSAVVWKLNQQGLKDIVIVDHLGSSDKWRNLASLRFLDYIEKDRFLFLLEGPFGSEPGRATSITPAPTPSSHSWHTLMAHP